ncbi:hypothetical protein, partial [Escherichia coli]|uniref:hypothetical protein n=1 Tax=Escherichia coli TaxID=562 RepID=UPI001CCA02D1
GTVCVVGKMRDLILQLSKSSIYSTKPSEGKKSQQQQSTTSTDQQSRAEIRWKYPKIELADGVTDISQ